MASNSSVSPTPSVDSVVDDDVLHDDEASCRIDLSTCEASL